MVFLWEASVPNNSPLRLFPFFSSNPQSTESICKILPRWLTGWSLATASGAINNVSNKSIFIGRILRTQASLVTGESPRS